MHALPWRPQHTPGMGRGVGLALVAHALLLVALKFGVDWRTSNQEPAFEAELWSAVPRAAAPRAEEPPPPPPEPEVKAQPAKPPVEDPSVAQREADIRLEKDRQRKEREKERERLEKERQDKLKADKRRAEEARLAKEKADKADKAEKDRLDKLRNAQRDQQLADAKREQLRQDQLRRIQGLAGASGGPNATGTALQSSGPSASYAGRVMARVRPNIRPTKDYPRELVTDVLVRSAPDGTILSATVRRSSGNAEWDEWAVRAVLATANLPRDTDGTVPKELVIGIRPSE